MNVIFDHFQFITSDNSPWFEVKCLLCTGGYLPGPVNRTVGYEKIIEWAVRHKDLCGQREAIKEVKKNESDLINHPAHYGGEDNPYEAIKVIEAWELGFNLGNCVKYISRAGKKGDRLQDLQKALWYLKREIENTH